MSDRIESIRAMLTKDPEDTFLLYSPAMAYAAGRVDQARRTFAAAREPAAAQGEKHVSDYVRQQLDALGQ